jgi:uncharacterized protein YgfB (UPF0149 family)
MTSPAVELAEFVRAVAELQLGTDAFEFHGGVCGLLCTLGPGAVDHWLHESRVAIRADIEDRASLLEALHAAEADAWRALHALSFDFDLLLPAEEADLDDRVAALAAWCHGFVTGVGLGGLRSGRSDTNEPSEIDEILADLTEISRVALSDEDASDAERAGFDLAAVTEHVRVCVQLVFERLRASYDPDTAHAEPALRH